jgi:hypothetical protein
MLLAVVLLACGGGPLVADGTPTDLESLVVEAMGSIEQAIPAQAACLRGVTITHGWELEDRAEYRTETRTIVLRVPATADDLEFSLAHEIAHHLELTCEGHADLRALFLQALGYDATRSWFSGDSWETTPSEQFATAIARLVTGRPDPLRRVVVTEKAMDVVERWAEDGAVGV